MFPWQTVLLLVALLCAAGRCQDTEDDKLKEEYLEKCKEGRSNLKNMDVYLYQSSYCIYWCYGQDEDENYISEVRSKDDGVECTNFFSMVKEPQQCLNGTCVMTADVKLCEERAPSIGKVQHLECKDCSVTCTGYMDIVVDKLVGDPCQMQDQVYKEAKCNAMGRCAEVMTFVSDESGQANDDAGKAVCEDRHQDSDEVYPFQARTDDPCQYGCYCFQNDGTNYELEYVTFKDGTPCGEGLQCLGGRCSKPEDIEACQSKLTDGLVEMESKECNILCYGKASEAAIEMPFNSTCYMMIDGWYPQEGLCNEDSKCIAKESDD